MSTDNNERRHSGEHSSRSSGSSHRSHHSHSSHSSHGSHRSSGNSKSKGQSNFSEEYSKEKKIRLWWRSLFIVIIVTFVAVLAISILTSNVNESSIFAVRSEKTNSTDEMQTEIDRLKTENMNLKYELEKYIEEFGELDAEEEEEDEEEEDNKKSSSKKSSSKK